MQTKDEHHLLLSLKQKFDQFCHLKCSIQNITCALGARFQIQKVKT